MIWICSTYIILFSIYTIIHIKKCVCGWLIVVMLVWYHTIHILHTYSLLSPLSSIIKTKKLMDMKLLQEGREWRIEMIRRGVRKIPKHKKFSTYHSFEKLTWIIIDEFAEKFKLIHISCHHFPPCCNFDYKASFSYSHM